MVRIDDQFGDKVLTLFLSFFSFFSFFPFFFSRSFELPNRQWKVVAKVVGVGRGEIICLSRLFVVGY